LAEIACGDLGERVELRGRHAGKRRDFCPRKSMPVAVYEMASRVTRSGGEQLWRFIRTPLVLEKDLGESRIVGQGLLDQPAREWPH
jgi:hypothetical protein